MNEGKKERDYHQLLVYTYLILTTNVPHGKVNLLVLDGLHVESNRWNGGHVLVELQLVENGGLSGGVETNHQNTGFLVL